ncbi:MAG TPA: hypothetical protein P5526_28350, partial [Anaerolineae bacterium]|nr:hypothetical protein [Anaerolineae bacterium]
MTTHLKSLDTLYEKTAPAQLWLAGAIRVWALVVLTLHLAAATLPEETAWSLWPYTFLPTWLAWGLALLVGTLVISPVNDLISRAIHRLWLALPAKQAKHR